MTFSDVYQEVLKKPTPRQLFLKRIAEATGTTESTVQKWVSGFSPKRATCIKIAEELKMDWRELFPERDKWFNTVLEGRKRDGIYLNENGVRVKIRKHKAQKPRQ